ncbi:MAG TPA: response regulator transcription factor [Pyrinomonadaceae bacterium]|nr:response regulator transcription factor [Pyrinomonadaceae bacterium]
MTRIMLADDHEVVRKGLRAMLETRKGWEVCGEAATGREAVRLAAELQPDIAVIDLSMPELDGLEATRRIRHEAPGTEVLVFTMYDTPRMVREVLAAGARGYVLKSDAARHLITAVETLSEHKPYFTSAVSESILEGYLQFVSGDEQRSAQRAAGGTPNLLTRREREIVQLLAENLTNKEVAAKLSISVKTVETHRGAIMRKLGLNSIVELVYYALRNKIVELEDREPARNPPTR